MDREFTPKANAIAFDQPAEFHMRRYLRHREQGKLPEAMQDLYRAYDKDRDNFDIIFAIAELACELGRSDQSNEFLLMHLYRPDMKTPEVYALLGRNFLTLGDWDQARECLELCLNMDPDMDTEYMANHMLDVLEDELQFEEELEAPAPAIHLVGADQTDLHPQEMLYIATLQAQQGKLDQALATLDQRERIYGEDVQGDCARAMFCLRADRIPEGEQALQRAKEMAQASPQELILLADTLGYLGKHREVLEVADRLLRYHEENSVILHTCAVAHFNLGHYKKAKEIWNRLMMVDPEDQLFAWCADVTTDALSGEGEHTTLSYRPVIPGKEIYRHARTIQRAFRENVDLEQLRGDAEWIQALYWLLDMDENCDYASLLQALYFVEGEKAEPVLRKMLVRRGVPDPVKQQILEYLREMGKGGPYIVLTEDGVMEMSLVQQEMEDSVYELNDVQQQVLSLAEEHMQPLRDEQLRRLRFTWCWLCKHAGLDQIRKPNGWAAALHYLMLLTGAYGQAQTQKELAQIYQVNTTVLTTCVSRLRVYLHL